MSERLLKVPYDLYLAILKRAANKGRVWSIEARDILQKAVETAEGEQ
jgi:plasmid stability protein